MPSLFGSLPFDIWHQIASCLEPVDYVRLGLAHPQLRRLLQDEVTARKVAKLHIAHTAEAKLAADGKLTYHQALERVYLVREAVATAQPFSASLIAYGDSFRFNQGSLCYLDTDTIRVLNVHQAAQEESVVNIKVAFFTHLGVRSSFEKIDAHFTLLSYSDGIVVCLCELQDPRKSWLFAMDIHTRRVRHRRLRNTRKLFVRHNASFLYYGTHSGTGRDCHREWLVNGVDLETDRDITDRPVQLKNFAGSDIGPTVCFEIHDGFLYAISNQTGFEDEEIDWTSYYVCLRFPLCDPNKVQWQRLWRRQHREGPISDTWTDLSLRVDESTGQLMIVECRREWLNGASENFRTYYTQPLNWGETGQLGPAWAIPSTAAAAATAESEATDSPPDPTLSNPGLPAYMPLHSYPDDPLATLLDATCKPNYEPPKKRLRRHYHPEYAETEPRSSDRKDFIHSRTKHSAYNQPASAFIDLVNDPPAQSTFFSKPADRLRLRVGSRKRKSPIDEDGEEIGSGLLYPPEHFDHNGTPMDMSEERFESRGIRLWPPNDAPTELLSLLCPSGRTGKVDTVSDERCLVYSTQPSEHEGRRPIILISFDPSIHFRTFQPLNVTPDPESPETAPKSARDSSYTLNLEHVEQTLASRSRTRCSKPSVHPAQYLNINRGYWLR